MNKSKEYTCEACGKHYLMGWDDEEATKEAKEVWGETLGENPAIVCDDCYQEGMKRMEHVN